MGAQVPQFLSRTIIIFWVLRDIFLALNIAAYAIIIVALGANKDELEDKYNISSGSVGAAIGISAAGIVLCLISLAVDIFCIFKRIRNTLTPKFFLIAQSIQTVFWTISLVLHIVGARTWTGILFAVGAFLLNLALLFYAIRIYRASKNGTLGAFTTGGGYTQTNLQPYGGARNMPHNPDPEEGHKLVGNPSQQNMDTGYAPQVYVSEPPKTSAYGGYGDAGYGQPQPYDPVGRAPSYDYAQAPVPVGGYPARPSELGESGPRHITPP